MKLALQRITFAALSLLAKTAFAATNAAEEADIPKLAPPTPEIPPTFWEQNGTMILVIAAAVLIVAIIAVLIALRPRPVPVAPPDVQARNQLKALGQQTETGETLTRVSQVLRRYFIAAFGLSAGEFTTAEFCRILSQNETAVGRELNTSVSDFLQRCDQQKFSPKPGEPLNAASRALEFVALAEARRTQQQPSAAPKS